MTNINLELFAEAKATLKYTHNSGSYYPYLCVYCVFKKTYAYISFLNTLFYLKIYYQITCCLTFKSIYWVIQWSYNSINSMKDDHK